MGFCHCSALHSFSRGKFLQGPACCSVCPLCTNAWLRQQHRPEFHHTEKCLLFSVPSPQGRAYQGSCRGGHWRANHTASPHTAGPEATLAPATHRSILHFWGDSFLASGSGSTQWQAASPGTKWTLNLGTFLRVTFPGALRGRSPASLTSKALQHFLHHLVTKACPFPVTSGSRSWREEGSTLGIYFNPKGMVAFYIPTIPSFFSSLLNCHGFSADNYAKTFPVQIGIWFLTPDWTLTNTLPIIKKQTNKNLRFPKIGAPLLHTYTALHCPRGLGAGRACATLPPLWLVLLIWIVNCLSLLNQGFHNFYQHPWNLALHIGSYARFLIILDNYRASLYDEVLRSY